MKPEKSRAMSLWELRARTEIENFDAEDYIKNENEDHYLTIRDPQSTFYLLVDTIEVDAQGKIYYGIEFSPANESTSEPYGVKISSNQLNDYFTNWKRLVEEYNTHFPPSDPIFEQSKKEFYDYFELVDVDKDTHSFSFPQQILIDYYINYFTKALEEHKENNELTEEKKSAIDDVIEETKELKETQTRLTKNQIVKKFADLLAKSKGISIKMVGEVRSEILKYIVRGAMDDPQGFIDKLKRLLPNPTEFIDLVNTHLLG